MAFISWKLDAIIVFIIGVFTIVYLYLKRKYSYWERNGIKTLPNCSLIFGHLKTTFMQKESIGTFVRGVYNSINEPFIGIYSVLRPILVVRDPELIRSILIKDFTHFNEHGAHCNEKYDPLSGHLFALPGHRWKNLRGKLSPAFTSGKLKSVFSTLVDCGKILKNRLAMLERTNGILDAQETAVCLSIDCIVSTAFGIKNDSINNPQNDFRVCGRKIFESSFYNSIRQTFNFFAPKLMTVFRIKIADPSVEQFIRSVVKQNLEYREKNNIIRKDLFQLFIQIRNTGTVQLDDEWETVIKADENSKSLSLDEIAAQTFIFFAAGFDATSATVMFSMYELAKNQDIQKQVHDEIDRVLAEHDGNITYESVSAMKYLESCIEGLNKGPLETLRMYPGSTVLDRLCVQDYHIPGTDKVIEKGTQVFIPALALQMDEKYYENPEKFDPGRYAEENSAKHSVNRPFLPYGEGPRACIGMRLGKMITKVGIVMMLQDFRLDLDETLKNRKLDMDPKQIFLFPREKIQLRVFKR